MLDNQPILKKIFENALKQQKFANAYLLIGEHATIYPDQIVAWITKAPERVLQGNYQDYIKFEDDLKKEHVIQLQKYFTNKPSEMFSKKIYTILNVDKASVAALNALLKFLEEPVSDTIAILTATNKERVLPTILSRTQVIHLADEEKQYSEEVMLLFNTLEIQNDIDALFLVLHQHAKKLSYLDFYDIYQLLIEKYMNSMDYTKMYAFVEMQNQFEKSCNIALVLDQTLFLIKTNNSRNVF